VCVSDLRTSAARLLPHARPAKEPMAGEEMRTLEVGECGLIDFPVIPDPRGNLTFVEGMRHVPFEIKRVYYLYDVPGGEERGGHAHRDLEQVIIAMSGSFDVVLDDAQVRREITLNRSYFGLYVSRMVWRELVNFSSGSVCLVLASRPYEAEDYLYDYDEFAAERRRR
jgi:hypothetical protein